MLKMIIEGYYPIKFALQNKYPFKELFICPRLFRSKFNNIILVESVRQLGVPITKVSKEVFKKISNFNTLDGLLAIAPQKKNYLKDHKLDKRGLYILIESIEKFGNLGAIFRLADNSGASGVIVCDMRADICNCETFRSSLGTFFSINIFLSTTKEAIAWCKNNQIKIMATSPNTGINYTEVNMSMPIGIVMGTEYFGLSKGWLDNADIKIKIPMHGQANSLSVTASTAIILYEALRQRKS